MKSNSINYLDVTVSKLTSLIKNAFGRNKVIFSISKFETKFDQLDGSQSHRKFSEQEHHVAQRHYVKSNYVIITLLIVVKFNRNDLDFSLNCVNSKCLNQKNLPSNDLVPVEKLRQAEIERYSDYFNEKLYSHLLSTEKNFH